MNKVILSGRLTRDPETKQTGDMSITKFSLAVERKTKKDEEKKADFINCTCFGDRATFVGKYFHKGDGITLEGRIQTGSYKNKDGATVYTTDVIVDTVEFPLSNKGSKNANSRSNDVSAQQTTNDGFVNVPDGIEEELPFT